MSEVMKYRITLPTDILKISFRIIHETNNEQECKDFFNKKLENKEDITNYVLFVGGKVMLKTLFLNKE